MGIVGNILFTLTICVWIGIGYMYKYAFSQEDSGLNSTENSIACWFCVSHFDEIQNR